MLRSLRSYVQRAVGLSLSSLALSTLSACTTTGPTVKFFESATIKADVPNIVGGGVTTWGPSSLKLDTNQDVFIPPGFGAKSTIATLVARGECAGQGKVSLSLYDYDGFFDPDDKLDQHEVPCDPQNKFIVQFTLMCVGNLWPTVQGPLESSWEWDAEIYVKDDRGAQQIPFPGGSKFWYVHCEGGKLEIRDR